MKCFLVTISVFLVSSTIYGQECDTIKQKIKERDCEIIYDSSIRLKGTDNTLYSEAQAKKKLKKYEMNYEKFRSLVDLSVKKMGFVRRDDRFFSYKDSYFIVDRKTFRLTILVEEFRIMEPGKVYTGYEVTNCPGIYKASNRAVFEIVGNELGQWNWLYE